MDGLERLDPRAAAKVRALEAEHADALAAWRHTSERMRDAREDTERAQRELRDLELYEQMNPAAGIEPMRRRVAGEPGRADLLVPMAAVPTVAESRAASFAAVRARIAAHEAEHRRLSAQHEALGPRVGTLAGLLERVRRHVEARC